MSGNWHRALDSMTNDYIIPQQLHQLYWLSVQKLVDFKMAILVSGTAPAYLTADCQLLPEEGRHQLCSANSRICVVTRQADLQQR